MGDLTSTQKRVIRGVFRALNSQRQIGGHRMAPFLQSARSLVRKGLLTEYRTSQFGVTKAGKQWVEANPDGPKGQE